MAGCIVGGLTGIPASPHPIGDAQLIPDAVVIDHFDFRPFRFDRAWIRRAFIVVLPKLVSVLDLPSTAGARPIRSSSSPREGSKCVPRREDSFSYHRPDFLVPFPHKKPVQVDLSRSRNHVCRHHDRQANKRATYEPFAVHVSLLSLKGIRAEIRGLGPNLPAS